MAVNIVVLDGVAQHVALRYDEHARPELRFTLQATDHATDGKPWTSYWPCTASGSAAERLAGEITAGEHIVLTSAKLCYRKRSTKLGEQSRLEVLVWTVDKLSDDSASGGSVSGEGAPEIVQPEPTSAAPAPKARRPRVPRMARQPWQPEHAN
jgi:hypothetical protein